MPSQIKPASLSSLYPARLLRRYKRFLADIRLPDGTELTVHCPNTGSMKHCLVEDSPCWYSVSDNSARKYAHTLELVTTRSGHLAGINTARANRLVARAIASGIVAELSGYGRITPEQRYGKEKSRIDFLLQDHAQDLRRCYLEVKNVTLLDQGPEGDWRGFFPDAVSERGSRHLRELMEVVQAGQRAVLFFCVQHSGIDRISPADHIDIIYGRTLREAIAAGVEVLAYGATMRPAENRIELTTRLVVDC